MAEDKPLLEKARERFKFASGYVEMRLLAIELADALEAASVERAVVEAQALEQAARFLREHNWAWNHTDGAMEAARAVELLAIDKSRETR